MIFAKSIVFGFTGNECSIQRFLFSSEIDGVDTRLIDEIKQDMIAIITGIKP